MSELKLDTVDVDGAIRDQAEDLGLDRGDFFKKAAVAGGGVVAGGALFGPFLENAAAAISRKRSNRNDIRILNFALTLEFLEAEFYERALRNNAFASPQYRVFGEVVADHEADHVRFLRKALGGKAIKKPSFDFGETVRDSTQFAATAQVLEDTGVRAYLGQVGNIKARAILGAAGTIATVEARHASWIRFLNTNAAPGTRKRDLPAPRTFDQPASERTILRAVGATNFIQS